eukprot:6198553-Pleurochrysis_carterae.AAC.2
MSSNTRQPAESVSRPVSQPSTDQYLGTIITQISSNDPQGGPLAELYSDLRWWRDMGDIPRNPIGCIRSAQLCFTWCRLPQM